MVLIQQSTNSETLAELTEGVQSLHNSIAPDKFKPFDEESFKLYFEKSLDQDNTFAIIAYKTEVPVGYMLYEVIQIEND